MRVLLTASGERVALGASRVYTLGRDSKCDIVARDLACSRRHALVTVDADAKSVYVEDLGSSNGTYVNDERIADRTLLKLGSRVRIGGTVYVLHSATARSPSELDLAEAGTLTMGIEEELQGIVDRDGENED